MFSDLLELSKPLRVLSELCGSSAAENAYFSAQAGAANAALALRLNKASH